LGSSLDLRYDRSGTARVATTVDVELVEVALSVESLDGDSAWKVTELAVRVVRVIPWIVGARCAALLVNRATTCNLPDAPWRSAIGRC
jgi:hypothetical protein